MIEKKVQNIIANKKQKISIKELNKLIFELKQDCFDRQQKYSPENWRYSFFNGEINAFQIVLDLLEHIEP